MMNDYWAYVHRSGVIHVRRYREDDDEIRKMREDPDINKVYNPFCARNVKDALDIVKAAMKKEDEDFINSFLG